MSTPVEIPAKIFPTKNPPGRVIEERNGGGMLGDQ
jgi:hypothetical protein